MVVNGDVHSLGAEGHGDGGPHAPSGAGHQSPSICEVPHPAERIKPVAMTLREHYTPRQMITLTEKAAAKVMEIREAESLGNQGLRVRVLGGGCSGFSYDLFFEEEVTELDQHFESHGIPLYIDMMSYQYLEGTEIDYVEGLHGAGFKFLNPQAKATCGCGSSFSA
jgi:iron-sulfur cluster insertion protein